MIARETFAVALEALRVNKLRSFLTMLGIVIGVSALIAMVALGEGARNSVNAQIASLGTTLVSVMPGQVRGGGGVASGSERAALTIDDAEAIADRAEHVVAVQPEMTRSLQVRYESRNTNTSIVGTSANFLEVRKFELAAGRMFTAADDAARRRVAVLGPQVLEDLGVRVPSAILGESVRIGTVQFEVVGVLASKSQSMGFGDPDDQVLIPLEAARYRLFGTERVRSINVLAATEGDVSAAMAEVRRILRREHRLAAGQSDDFQLRNQADFLSTLGKTTQTFTTLLAGIAVVSLLVGGIGIMNIMLVSVTERTREIGIRKAIGATRFDILFQFLIEALVLCLLGGALGVALGGGAAIALRLLFQWNTSVGPMAIVVALGFSFAVGVGFGVWPARRAASLNPIEALRYE